MGTIIERLNCPEIPCFLTCVPFFPKRLQTTLPTAPEAPKTVATDPENDERYPGPRFMDVKVGTLEVSPDTPAIDGLRPVSDFGRCESGHTRLVL